MRLFDTHIHMDDPRFDEDRDPVLNSLKSNGVELILNPAADMKGCRDAVALSQKYPFVYAAVGVHPSEVENLSDADIDEMRSLAALPKTVAIGEIGLDYHFEDSPSHEVQRAAFIRQLELVKETDLPVIIHSRDASAETLEIIKASGIRKGVVHCFGGSKETAREYLDLGFHISFTGVITFSNAKRYEEIVASVPLERMMIETDGPYMAPTPHRGERNESRYVLHVAEKIAEIKGIDVEEVAETTFLNGCAFFGIPVPVK